MSNKQKFYSVGFWVLVLSMSFFFLTSVIHKTSKRPFWQDEQLGFRAAVRVQPVSDLLLKGAAEQASLSPLDYLFLKGLDAVKVPVRYFGLNPQAYFRLISTLSTLLVCWLIGFMAWQRWLKEKEIISFLSPLLIAYALFAYFFTETTYYYSAEMRPYSLWNALWFLIGAILLYCPEKRWLLFFVSILMGLTSSAAIFQFVALGSAWFILYTILGQPWKKNIINAAVLFIPPFLLALKYVFLDPNYGYANDEGQDWGSFLRYMLTNEYVPVLTILAVVLCFLNRETRQYSFPALALFILYCLGPLIFHGTHSRGMFFANRQYIYYSTAIPFFFLIAAVILPDLYKKWSQAWIKHSIGLGFFLLIGVSYMGYFHKRIIEVNENFSSKTPFGFLKDDQGYLANLLQMELPKNLCLDWEGGPPDLVFAFELWGEWLPVRYRNNVTGAKNVVIKIDNRVPYVAEVTTENCPNRHVVETGEPATL